MPAVTNRGRGVAHEAVLPRTPAASKQFRRPRTPKTEDEDELCPVCLDGLTNKRKVTLESCRHEMHRTCALQWLETRESSAEHRCPMCRAFVIRLKNHIGVLMPQVRNFGATGQPTMEHLIWTNKPSELAKKLKELAEWELAKSREEESRAAREQRSADYMEDFKIEQQKLTRRIEILADLKTRTGSNVGAPLAPTAAAERVELLNRLTAEVQRMATLREQIERQRREELDQRQRLLQLHHQRQANFARATESSAARQMPSEREQHEARRAAFHAAAAAVARPPRQNTVPRTPSFARTTAASRAAVAAAPSAAAPRRHQSGAIARTTVALSRPNGVAAPANRTPAVRGTRNARQSSANVAQASRPSTASRNARLSTSSASGAAVVAPSGRQTRTSAAAAASAANAAANYRNTPRRSERIARQRNGSTGSRAVAV